MKLTVLVVGDNGCGKTSLLKSFLQPKLSFDTAHHPTSLEKYFAKLSQHRRGLSAELELVELGGGLKDRNQHYASVDVVLVCFSVVSQESFDNVGKWVVEIEREAAGGASPALLLVGCKRDLRVESETLKQRHISQRSGQAKSKSLGAVGYVECSSLNREGIREVFDQAVAAVPISRLLAQPGAGRRLGDEELTGGGGETDKDSDFAIVGDSGGDEYDAGDWSARGDSQHQKGGSLQGVIKRGLVGFLMGNNKPTDTEPQPTAAHAARRAARTATRPINRDGRTGDTMSWSADGSDSETVVQLIRHVSDRDAVEMTPAPPAPPPPPPITNGFLRPPALSVEKLLAKKDVTVQDLMHEDLRTDLMREFRLRNKSLIEFLSRPGTLLDLISYITKGPSTQEQFCACELLTADVASILDGLCSDESLAALFSLMTEPPPLPHSRHQAAEYFKRVATFLMSNRSIEFMLFLMARTNSCQEFVDHLATPAIVSLLLQCLQCEKTLDSQGFSSSWSPGLLGCLETRLQRDGTADNVSEEEDYVSGLLEFVTQLVAKFPGSPLIRGLQQSEVARPVLRHALDESSPLAAAYMRLLICLVDTCRNPQPADPLSLSPPPVEPEPPPLITEFIEPTTFEALARPRGGSSLVPPLPAVLLPPLSPGRPTDRESGLQRLYQLLNRPAASLPPSITTSAGVVAPFGMFRIKCIELLLALLRTHYGSLDRAIIDDRLVARSVDLFFQFKWNNVLHSLIVQMASLILTTKPDSFCLYLLRDCHLLDRILQVQQNDEQELKMRGQQENRPTPRYAYMGHLYMIANCIVASSREQCCLFYLLEDTPGWRKFEGKLKLLNQLSMPDHVAKVEKKAPMSFLQSFAGGLRFPSLSD